ncbi:MAG: PAS domain-containing sensor histidine kinase [bacterium]
MVYKRFRVVVMTRVLILSASLYLFIHLLFGMETRLYATILIVALTIAYQIHGLIHYVEKTNRDLNRFLMTIKHEDFSQIFLGGGLGSSFDELKRAFNDVIQKFQQARAEKEEHFRYLQTVVQHVAIGLIAFRSDGKVALFNTAAKKLFRKPALRNIKDLEGVSKLLTRTLLGMHSGQKALVKIHDQNEILQLSISATEFRLREQNYTLVSLQNIHSELEEQELDAWQKLIRVLTHEIMNSVTPIASLASTLNELVNSQGNRPASEALSAESRCDLQGGLKTIQKRSEGLLHFVNAYRNLTKIPVPDLKIFPVQEVFEHIQQLMREEIGEDSIAVSSQVLPTNLELTADRELLEQILINLLKNAIQALQGRPQGKISLFSRIDERGRIIIQICDNGPGIPPELHDKIFIPFFTTKEGGSGIGLSLSRQIMRLHRGTLSVHSRPDDGTVFTLRF